MSALPMAPTSESPQVLIVGGGPSGLVLAICLIMNGVPVRIIEKSSLPRLGQRGAGIMPRSLELFAAIRIIEDVMKRAISTPPARLYKMPDGVDVMHEFEMSPHLNPTPTNPFLNPVMLGQDSLEEIFHKRLKELGCEVEFGTELESFEHYQTHVTAHLVKRGFSQDMSTGEREAVNFAWMVGADGARGVVRKQLGLTFMGETNIENFIVGDIRVEGLSQKYWHIWGDATDVLVSLRATETPKLFNFLVGGKNVNHASLSNDHPALIQFFRDHTGRHSDLKFLDIPWMSQYRPNIRMVDRFGYGRIYITGDAGHVHSPTGGQGMNTGIQDSFNLAWKLALVAKGISPPSLLGTFSEERIPVISEMIAQTTRLLKQTLGNDERALKTDGTLYQLGVNYRWSSVVVDERKKLEADREADEDAYLQDYKCVDEEDDDPNKLDSYGADHDGRLRAGDRAPDSSGLVIHSPAALAKRSSTCQLFQIFGAGHHTMLVFVDIVASKDILRALQAYPKALVRTVVVSRAKMSLDAAVVAMADFVLEDREGHAYNAYCPTDVCGFVIVRPDGIVGAITRTLAWMHQYFSGVYIMQ